ncbi:MAG TPA: hypothetical protein VJ694_01310 [Patescibacteria group bacterium]|nr:hypothetical protein [Patescibacteria group bacterium]
MSNRTLSSKQIITVGLIALGLSMLLKGSVFGSALSLIWFICLAMTVIAVIRESRENKAKKPLWTR